MTDAIPTTSPTSDVTVFGMNLSTIITSVLFPLLLTIFGVWLATKWRDRLRLRIVSKLNSKEFEQLSALYCERVPDYERVPPNHFRVFFRREYSAKSVRDFRRRIYRTGAPVHLLLVAQTSRGISGFLKAIFIPDVRCLFIAYLVTAPANNYEERTVAQKLVSYLFATCRNSAITNVVYEICAKPQTNHKAKARLFRHYASALGVQLRRIAAKYRQPEICSFDAGDCKLTDAELYIAHMDNQAQIVWHSISREEYEKLVSAIYMNVYLMSYALAEPQLTEKYRDFLRRVMRNLFVGTKNKTIDLK